jgi:hypothetical protein
MDSRRRDDRNGPMVRDVPTTNEFIVIFENILRLS